MNRLRPALLLSSLLLAGVACAPPANTGGDAGPDGPPPGACALKDDCGEGDGRPSRRSEAVGVWDPQGQRVILFGGSDAVPQQCAFPTPNFLDETWAFEPRCGVWKQLTNPGPSPRGRHMMAYDPNGHRALLFGGRYRSGGLGNYTNFNDLWQLDLESDTWSELSTTSPPTARVNGSFVVNADGTKAYLFGGNLSLNGSAYNPQNDLWELDLSTYTWTQLSPAGTPPSRRLFHAGLFDPVRNRVVVMGGGDETAFFNDAVYFNDVWAYDVASNAWLQLHDGSGQIHVDVPSRRFWGEWVYDDEDDAYLLFGGHDDQNLGNANDLWAFDPSSDSWQLMRLGDTFNKPANGFCDFPPDFTNLDQEAPERRNAHVVVFASGGECPGLITTMGKTDCGAADDVHRWSIGDGKWQELSRAREGEMCLRTEPEFDCQDMCF